MVYFPDLRTYIKVLVRYAIKLSEEAYLELGTSTMPSCPPDRTLLLYFSSIFNLRIRPVDFQEE